MVFMFNCYHPQVVFQEVPNEISLAFLITGCPFACKGCHSEDSWQATAGFELSLQTFRNYLNQYQHLITCIVFFGGDWQQAQLIKLLQYAQSSGLKTCLYSGAEKVSDKITQHLNFLKTGCWQAELGGLSSKKTNQRFIDVKTQILLNYQFLGN